MYVGPPQSLTLWTTDPSDRPAPSAPHKLTEAFEADIAGLSSHLAALKTYLLPIARRALPEQRDEIDALLHESQESELVLHVLHQLMHGAHTRVAVSVEELQRRLGRSMDRVHAAEQKLAEDLDAVLSPEQEERLLKHLEQALHSGPTRPHPHASQRRGLRRLTFHVDSFLDHTLDTLESRVLPRQPVAQQEGDHEAA